MADGWGGRERLAIRGGSAGALAVVNAMEARPPLFRAVVSETGFHDAVRGEWTLVAPERMVKANPTAVAVLERCTGEATLAAIVDGLAQAFSAPRERVEADVRVLLAQLHRSGLVAW